MGGQAPWASELKKANTSLLTGIGDAQQAATTGYSNQMKLLNDAYASATQALNTHVNTALQSGEQWAQVGLEAYKNLNQGYNDPNAALSSFLDSADYKLFYGNANGEGGDPNKSALDRFKESPDYQFRLNQTLDAMNRRASAGGYSNDPRMQQELMKQGGDMASQEYGNYFNRLNTVYNNYNQGQLQSAQLGMQAMQGNQQLRYNLGLGLSGLASNWGQNQVAINQGYTDAMANAGMAKGQANAQYRLTRAAMFAPAMSGGGGGAMGAASSATQGFSGGGQGWGQTYTNQGGGVPMPSANPTNGY